MRRFASLAALAIAAPTALMLAAAPAHAAGNSTVSILHGIPGAANVDVYAGDQLLIKGFNPGDLKTLEIPEGTYDLGVYASGDKPGSGTPAVEAKGVQVPGGINATVTANLDAGGKPALNVFVNDTTMSPSGKGRLVVRHVAAAPAVDVRAGGAVAFAALENPKEASADLGAGTVSADVVLAGTDTVAIGPADVTVKEGTTTVVYAWGSATDKNLTLAVQEVAQMPSGVPAGDGSSAPIGTPIVALGVAAAAGVIALAAGARLSRTRA